MTATLIPFPRAASSGGRASSRAVPPGGRASSRAASSGTGINTRQKALLHIYKSAAGLSDPEYRHILRGAAHVPSAADPAFSQGGFDRAMAALEGELALRVDTRRVPPPPRSRIQRLDYWRSKVSSGGRSNIRQRHAIEESWSRLAEYLGQAAPQEYLLGIIAKATGKRVLPHQLSATEAGRVIDALKSRLAAAIRASNATTGGTPSSASAPVAGVGDPGSPVAGVGDPGEEDICPF